MYDFMKLGSLLPCAFAMAMVPFEPDRPFQVVSTDLLKIERFRPAQAATLIVDQQGGGDHTTIQGATDACAQMTPPK